MGYDTGFEGRFTLNKRLSPEHQTYLHAFAEQRHMKRHENDTLHLNDPKRIAVGLPVGHEGMYYVDGGQESNSVSIVNSNHPPRDQPGLHCHWIPTVDGTGIEWGGMEKFYDYVEWLEYLIEHFLKPWGYVLSGAVRYIGEGRSDQGIIFVRDNIVEDVESTIENPGPSWDQHKE